MNTQKILALIAAMLPLGVNAQTISTPNDTVDCGKVIFKQPVKAEFKMKNTGNLPLLIKDVKTDCGCTTVDFPRQAIEPNSEFTVSATYYAKQMGHFFKHIGVYSNASTDPRIFTLRGVVVDKIINFKGEYPFTVGDLLTDKNDLEFDNVNRGDMPVQTIHFVNNGNDIVVPQLMHLPPYMTGQIKPSRVAPGHTGTVTVQVDSRKLSNLGLTQTSVYLGMFPGDKVAPSKELSVNIILTPDFEKMTDEQLAKAPRLKLSKGSLKMGSIEGNSKKKDRLEITNIGKSTLTIRSIQMLTVGLQISLNKQNIEPGESAKLKVTAIPELLRKARSKPRILLITNDPTQPKVMINVETEGLKKQQNL